VQQCATQQSSTGIPGIPGIPGILGGFFEQLSTSECGAAHQKLLMLLESRHHNYRYAALLLIAAVYIIVQPVCIFRTNTTTVKGLANVTINYNY
jgi:hypothetical protein